MKEKPDFLSDVYTLFGLGQNDLFDIYVLRVHEHHASTDICMARLAGINKAGFVRDGEQKVYCVFEATTTSSSVGHAQARSLVLFSTIWYIGL